MNHETIVVERAGRVGNIRLNRPEALNALNIALMNEVVAAAQEFDADRGIGAIVLSGSPRAFAAGADITEMSSGTYMEMYLRDWFRAWDSLARVRTPLIAAVSGYALGGGCELAMMCDIIVASETAKFGQPEIKLGVIPGIGGTQRLTRAVGKAKAMDLILTGRMMDAEEAEKSGLVARVVPAAQLEAVAAEIATTVASMSLPVAMLAKEAVNAAHETLLEGGIRFERHLFHSTFAIQDQAEGMSAFLDKRTPQFRNR